MQSVVDQNVTTTQRLTVHSEVELLGHQVTPFFIFRGSATPFSTEVVPFHIPTKKCTRIPISP